ncbi:rRNA maturation RNase YbeY [Thermincola ferriacetica]
MPVYVNNLQEKVEVPPELGETIERVANAVLEQSEFPGAEVGIVLVDDDYIHQLNKQYRGVDSPTDVLSFALIEDGEEEFFEEEKDLLLGDVFISVERAQNQAEEYGHSFTREMAYLTAHGMFHLLGYDHNTEEERDIMREKEEQVLTGLNITR